MAFGLYDLGRRRKIPEPAVASRDRQRRRRATALVCALTRAKNELYLLYPLMITDYNRQTIIQKPSRFITECPPSLFEVWDLEEEALSSREISLPDVPKTEYLN